LKHSWRHEERRGKHFLVQSIPIFVKLMFRCSNLLSKALSLMKDTIGQRARDSWDSLFSSDRKESPWSVILGKETSSRASRFFRGERACIAGSVIFQPFLISSLFSTRREEREVKDFGRIFRASKERASSEDMVQRETKEVSLRGGLP